MKKFLLLFCSVAAFLLMGAEPLLRFGAISDNHLNNRKPDSWERTRMAFEFFKKQDVRFFVDSGDITDTFQPDMFTLWRKMYLEVFNDEKIRPDFLMIPAGHDKSGAESTAKGYAEFVRLTGSGAVNPVKVVNGFHFVSLAQWENIKILKRNLDAAVAASRPGQPIFVVTHVPPRSTTGGSGGKASGDDKLRELLNKYPQVITLSGHTHNRLMDERAIWQGEFTAVNLGTLAYCGNGGIANPTDRPNSYDASIWEVYADKVIIRRFNVKSGLETFPERRWTIPLPFDANTAPYSAAKRAEYPIPEFADSATVGFAPETAANFRWGKLLLPPMKANSFALMYYVVQLQKKNASGNFEHFGITSFVRHQMPEAGKGDVFAFPAGYLEADSTYKITVTPINYFEKAGKTVAGVFSVGKVPWRELPVATYDPVWQPWKSSKTLPVDSEGFVKVEGDVRLSLPAVKNDVKTVVVSMDIECIGKGVPAQLRISNNRNQIISQNTGNYRKNAQKQRYSFVYQTQKKDKAHYLLIRRGSEARFRVSNMRIFAY